MQGGEPNLNEHSTVNNIHTKRVLMYGYDSTGLTPVLMAVSADGHLIVNNPISQYVVSDQDQYDTNTIYFGMLRTDGAWYILKQTTSGTTISYRYSKGTTDYATNWGNRATTLVYNYYNTEFA